MYTDIVRNLETVRKNIEDAAARAGRKPDEIAIMAITKTHPADAVIAAQKAGMMLFGENRVQEGAEKFSRIPRPFRLELVGHLQRNKAKQAAESFHAVQSIDKIETLSVLDKFLQMAGRTMDILIEVNTSGEDSKSGCRNDSDLFRLVEEAALFHSITLRGLMTIGPLGGDEKEIRKAFRSLKSLQEGCKRRFPGFSWDTLSMGMSGDYEIAVEEGSTIVRIGTALFGTRNAP